jgi:hypothetical protein
MKRLITLSLSAAFLIFAAHSVSAADENAYTASTKEDGGEFPKQVPPKKVTMDTNYDGKADRVELYDSDGQIERLETDTNDDGVIDEWVTFEKGRPVKKEKDTNADGKPDVFVEY